MGRESDYDNDGLDPSEEDFRKKKQGNQMNFLQGSIVCFI